MLALNVLPRIGARALANKVPALALKAGKPAQLFFRRKHIRHAFCPMFTLAYFTAMLKAFIVRE